MKTSSKLQSVCDGQSSAMDIMKEHFVTCTFCEQDDLQRLQSLECQPELRSTATTECVFSRVKVALHITLFLFSLGRSADNGWTMAV